MTTIWRVCEECGTEGTNKPFDGNPTVKIMVTDDDAIPLCEDCARDWHAASA